MEDKKKNTKVGIVKPKGTVKELPKSCSFVPKRKAGTKPSKNELDL